METKLKYKLADPLLMWVIIIAGGIACWFTVPGERIFSSGLPGGAVLVLGLANWAYVMYKAMRVHKQAPKSAQEIDKLVTEGAYAVVRHPIYAADIVLALAVFVFYPSEKVLAVVAWLAVVMLFWANFEERMLEEKFMDDYRAYKQRVPMFIPRFSRR